MIMDIRSAVAIASCARLIRLCLPPRQLSLQQNFMYNCYCSSVVSVF